MKGHLGASLAAHVDAQSDIHDILVDGAGRFNSVRLNEPASLQKRHVISDDIEIQLKDIARIHQIDLGQVENLAKGISMKATQLAEWQRPDESRTSW